MVARVRTIFPLMLVGNFQFSFENLGALIDMIYFYVIPKSWHIEDNIRQLEPSNLGCRIALWKPREICGPTHNHITHARNHISYYEIH